MPISEYTNTNCCLTRAVWAIVLLVLMLMVPACNVIGGGKEKSYEVKAAYRGLDNKSIAVLVSADEPVLYAHPNSGQEICRALTADLAMNIPGAQPIDPQQISRLHRDHPYWDIVPYADLIDWLGVERVLYVDLRQYTLHEPGNRYVWRGTIVANIGAIEAENPSNFAYYGIVKTQFPPRSALGVLEADEQTIELQTLQLFAEKVGRLFRDHTRIIREP